MKDSILFEARLETPCYVYSRPAVEQVLQRLRDLSDNNACQLLYSVKSANMTGLLQFIQPRVDGFSCSSLYELRLAQEIAQPGQSLHITTPGYRPDECERIFAVADYVSLNSVSQWRRLAATASCQASCGIRLNPELSFVADARYDPCRPLSKLGVTEAQLRKALADSEVDWQHIEGVTIHNNCEATDLMQLEQTVQRVLNILSGEPHHLRWFNLGGGYLWQKNADKQALMNAVTRIRQQYDVDIFLEPGKAITGQAGYLVARVIDLIEHDNTTVAVLDTSINHLPEVFEYQYQPAVLNSNSAGDYRYRLAGSSCLSGDLFGDYEFDHELDLGSRIIFSNVGAYMQVKANMFNGINLPSVYLLNDGGEAELLKHYDYEHYRSRI